MSKSNMRTKRNARERPVNILIGENLRFFRKSKGVTLKQLSDGLGLTYQQLQKYEAGENRLKIDTVIDIARYFEVSPVDMFALMLSTEEPADPKSLLSDEALHLVSLFESIEDTKIRKSLRSLLKGIMDQ